MNYEDARRMYDEARKTSNFKVSDDCIGCMLCAKRCPSRAIQMVNSRPQWVKDMCTLCLGCLHRCPQFAIQYGDKTKEHGQYKNPHDLVWES
jgi:NAD-dependent dihydropyrimidine dehydrogenase PreA subunit